MDGSGFKGLEMFAVPSAFGVGFKECLCRVQHIQGFWLPSTLTPKP